MAQKAEGKRNGMACQIARRHQLATGRNDRRRAGWLASSLFLSAITLLLGACATPDAEASNLATVSSSPQTQPDPVQVAPERYRVILENERVRVLDVSYPPGVTTDFHGHPQNLVVALTPIISNPVDANGNVTEYRIEAGEVLWREPATHRGTNSGDEEMHLIMIEFKEEHAETE